MSVCLDICVSVHLCVCLSVSLSLSFSFPFSLSLSLFFPLSLFLSLSLSIYVQHQAKNNITRRINPLVYGVCVEGTLESRDVVHFNLYHEPSHRFSRVPTSMRCLVIMELKMSHILEVKMPHTHESADALLVQDSTTESAVDEIKEPPSS